VVVRPNREINDPHSPAVQVANQPVWTDPFADLATIGCFGEPFQVTVDSAMNRRCVVSVVLQQGCDFGSEFGIISARASQVRSSIGQRKLERRMKNMFYEHGLQSSVSLIVCDAWP
jgi:hypothetical protein